MKYSDFKIGMKFISPTGRWLCTDIGTRIIIAIKIDSAVISSTNEHGSIKSKVLTEQDLEKAGWLIGPPYSLVEMVFDEDDIATCKKVD